MYYAKIRMLWTGFFKNPEVGLEYIRELVRTELQDRSESTNKNAVSNALGEVVVDKDEAEEQANEALRLIDELKKRRVAKERANAERDKEVQRVELEQRTSRR